jgi:hypothetical protein
MIASRLKLRNARSLEDRTAHAAPYLQFGVRGIDDSVDFHFRDVVSDYGKGHG